MATDKKILNVESVVQQKVEELNKLQLKGTDAINEFTKVMTEWDPRIISQAVRSNELWRQWVADDEQQQQQQQQHGR